MTMVGSRPRVLVLGAGGMLGSALARHLPERYPTWVTPTAVETRAQVLREPFEARDPRSLEAALDEARPDVVVNCVAVTATSPRSRDRAAAIAINAVFPHLAAARMHERGGRFIHISTDGVFSGARGGYRETDHPDPADFYGRAKLAGEVDTPGSLTIRATFFGRSPSGRGLVDWLLSGSHRVVEGYTDSFFSPLAAPVLAEVIGDLVAGADEGLLHVAGTRVTKCDVLAAAIRVFGLDVELRAVPSGRPLDRSLDASKFASITRRPLPSLDQMMERLKAPVAVGR